VKTKAILIVVALGALAGISAALAASSTTPTITVVTAASGGGFPQQSSYAGVSLQEWLVGTGVQVSSDGSATGEFEATLKGKSKSADVNIFLVGEAATGSVTSGTAQFSGTATLGGLKGLSATTGFSVTISASSLQLTIGTTTLPTMALGTGEAFIG
jgi:hypothetical protein